MIHTEGIKGGGGGRVGVGEDHDMGHGMQCIDHPHRNNPGGICAFCLQEKLGKLVSSSFPLPIRASSSSSPSSSPSFRSDTAASATARPSASITTATATSAPPPAAASSSSSLSLSVPPTSAKKNSSDHHYHEYYMRSRLPFLLAKKKKKKKKPSANTSSSSSAAAASSDIIFKRSKSTATPRRGQFLDDADDNDIVMEDFSPRKRNWFWSFLYLSSKPSAPSSSKKFDAKSFRDSSPRISTVNAASTAAATSGLSTGKQRDKCLGSSLGRKSDAVVEEGDDSPNSHATASASSFERKVSRSRSVGCGSRSFSGDFFERISTGFGDCTLRRVESQREGKPKVAARGAAVNHHHHHCMKERVRCGGIFGGFMMISSSSSSSSSSYWVSSSADDGMSGESAGVALSHGRARSWGWAFASPMRAFGSKTSSKDNKRDVIRDGSDKNATPNLSAIPSLLTVRG